jgi:hypothetical protein
VNINQINAQADLTISILSKDPKIMRTFAFTRMKMSLEIALKRLVRKTGRDDEDSV